MRKIEGRHRFSVIENPIGIFTEEISAPDFETRDGETIVTVSLGVGETHVMILNGEARRLAHWTAVFGWSSLCYVPIGSDEVRHPLEGAEQISRALRGTLRLYGQPVNTSGFLSASRAHFRSAIGYILDRTVGDGSDYDRIVIAAPVWTHEALTGCLDLRPHMWPEIQDL